MKNKNKPDEELKKIKGKIYYSDSEKIFYEIEGETQKPVDDVKKLKDDIFASLGETSKFLKSIFNITDENDDGSALPFI